MVSPSHCSLGKAFHLVRMSISRICKAKYLVLRLPDISRILSTCVHTSWLSLNWVRIWPATFCCGWVCGVYA